jgi:hypothetical protein
MFRALAGAVGNDDTILTVHPEDAVGALEAIWRGGNAVALGSGTIITDLQRAVAAPTSNAAVNTAIAAGLPLWHHLMYAYLIECTGGIEVLREIVRRFYLEELVDSPTTELQRWMRATEELVFGPPAPFATFGGRSDLRGSYEIVRRNIYWRAFGLDLPHPVTGPHAQAAWKSNVANTLFRERWSELLRQVWTALENRRNSAGANPADDNYIALLCQSLDDMLGARRQGGLLAREEFAAVATLDWLHLTVRGPNQVIAALDCAANTPEDRLQRLASKVGMKASRVSRELFDLADRVSNLLWSIEAGTFNTGTAARAFFDPTIVPTPPVQADINLIIDLWQSATGDPVKTRQVTITGTPAPGQPLRIPGSQPLAPVATAPSTNGVRR